MKNHTLKPGKHQFAPGEHAVHDNDNLTDAEAEWYWERYPHIKSLFIDRPEAVKTAAKPKRKRIGVITPKSVKSQLNENLSATN